MRKRDKGEKVVGTVQTKLGQVAADAGWTAKGSFGRWRIGRVGIIG